MRVPRRRQVVSGQSYGEQLAAQPASTVLITAGLGADCMRILVDESSWNGEACSSLRCPKLNELVSARPGYSGRLTQARRSSSDQVLRIARGETRLGARVRPPPVLRTRPLCGNRHLRERVRRRSTTRCNGRREHRRTTWRGLRLSADLSYRRVGEEQAQPKSGRQLWVPVASGRAYPDHHDAIPAPGSTSARTRRRPGGAAWSHRRVPPKQRACSQVWAISGPVSTVRGGQLR